MPSKIQLDENLWFLYICLQKSDLKTIDFAAVGASTNLKPPAARMRYTRLRRQIESGTLIGTHGTPFTGSADKIFEASTKWKRGGNAKTQGVSDTEDEEPVRARRGGRKSGENEGRRETVGKGLGEKGKGDGDRKGEALKVKEEQDSDFSSAESDFEDSEDEMPLAKRSRAGLGAATGQFASKTNPPTASKPYVSPYPSRMMIDYAGGNAAPRLSPGFALRHGLGGSFHGREDPRLRGLAPIFHQPVGRNEFVNGTANGPGGGVWGEMD